MIARLKYLLLALLVISVSCGEPKPSTLLHIGDDQFTADDFGAYLRVAHPATKPPMARAVLENFLNEFYEHKLLLAAARDRRYTAPDMNDAYAEEEYLISEFLNREVYKNLTVDDTSLNEMYEARFKEPRVRIQSIYFRNVNTANTELRALRRKPEQFDSMMDKYNPEGMKASGLGQGVFNRLQMPDVVRDAVFSQKKPGIVGPVDLGNGFLVIRIVEFLDKPSLDEVRPELMALLEPAERERLRNAVLQRLGKQYQIEFHRDVVLANDRFVIEPNEGAKK